jgi:hypothetical protein
MHSERWADVRFGARSGLKSDIAGPKSVVCERMLPGDSRVTLVGLIIAVFGVAFMFGGHPVISAMLLLLTWVLVMLDEDMKSG